MTWGQFAYDWREGVNVERLRTERLQKARKTMKERGLTALITMDPTNTRYLTGTATPPWMIRVPGWRYTLLVEGSDPLLYEHGDIKITTARDCPWLKGNVKSAFVWIRGSGLADVTEWAAKEWAEDLKKELTMRGYKKETIGLDVWEAPAVRALKNVGLDVAEGQPAMVDARVIKTQDEIECLRIAASISEAIFNEVQRTIRPGVRERDLVGVGAKLGWEYGLDDIIGFTVCSGIYGWPNFKYHTDRIIRPGDVVTFDNGGNAYNGYIADYYRTFSCGRPAPIFKQFYKRTYDWLYAAINAVRPGTTTKELCEKWPTAQDFGYKSEWEAIANQWGHGIGLSLYEPPSVTRIWSPKFPYTLRENMCFAMETQDGTVKDGGVRIEEMIRVTDTGHEILTKYPVDEIIECPLA